MQKNQSWVLWDHNHCKRLLNCWDKLTVASYWVTSLHRMATNQLCKVFMRRQRSPGCFSYGLFDRHETSCVYCLLSASCYFRCFSLVHNNALKTMRQPDFMAVVGSHTVHARTSITIWSLCSSLWFRCWKKTAEVVHHLRHPVRGEVLVLSVILFYSGL